MPLAIAANVGGTITMIGTPPNVIVTGALSAAGLPTFGFFEFAFIGVPLSIIIVLYTLFVGRRFLPYHSAGEMDEEASKLRKKKLVLLMTMLRRARPRCGSPVSS